MFEVCGPVRFSRELTDIAALRALRCVAFTGMINAEATAMTQIGLLGHKLGVERPEVSFALEARQP